MKLWSELRRRNVLRTTALYLVAAWLVLQVTDVLSGLIDLPQWLGPVVLAMMIIGLPVTVVLAWFFEITESGIERDAGTVAAAPDRGLTGRQLDLIIISMLAAAILVFAWATWWPQPPAEKSIAVLAFDNMSDDPAQEYFSDGIAEELLATLAQIPELRVISRSSAFSFKGKNLDVPTIAKRLNVEHILEGSVRKSGNQVRISAQLIQASTDSHLWSGTYERELTAANVFDIQTQIAASISAALNTVLTPGADAGSRSTPTRNLQALEAYLLGRQRMALRSRRNLAEAADYFGEAVQLDPEFASAWLGLADANLLLTYYGHIALDDALEVAGPALEKALDLHDRLGAAHASLGLMRSLLGDIQGAASALSRAIALDPNDAKAYHWYGDLLIYGFGDPGAAIPVLEQARQLDPLSPVIAVTLGEAFSAAGDLAEGIRLYRKAVEIDTEYLASFRLLGMAYLSLGDTGQAGLWIEEGVRRGPDEFGAISGKAFLYRALREEDAAVGTARHLQSLVPGNNVTLVTLVSFGRDREVIELAEADWPGLSCNGEPAVLRSNVFPAMNLSLAYERTGRNACSDALLEAILAVIQAPGLSPRAFGFLDAEIYARQGKTERALTVLRASVDAGMRAQWMTQVERSPHMENLRGLPAFLSIRDDVHTDLARQLARVRDLEASGELSLPAD